MICPILEARAEICEKRFTFWKIWRHQNFVLRLTDLYYTIFVGFYERKSLATLCHAKLYWLSALNNVSYHDPRCVLLWSWIFYENQCNKLSIFFIFCVNLIDTPLHAVIFLVHTYICTLTSNGLQFTEFLTPWLTLHIFL